MATHDTDFSTENGSAPDLSSTDHNAVREQLERVLASSLFRHSKRCTNLLRFSVEQRLNDELDCLKERSLGVEVFGRSPDYDTNHDPVVRTSAVEVRKRLAKYYAQPGRDGEIRIGLPTGCYVPEFHAPPYDPDASNGSDQPLPSGGGWRISRVWVQRAVATIVVMLGVSVMFAWKPWSTASSSDRFWAPVMAAPGRVLIAITGLPGTSAETDQSPPVMLSSFVLSGRNAVPLPDVTALADIAGSLRRMGKSYRIELAGDIELADLKVGPVIHVGHTGLWWNELVTDDLRFGIEADREAGRRWITDYGKRRWSEGFDEPADSSSEIYALITRVQNEMIGQPVVSIAGLSTFSTAAGGEFLSSPDLFDQVDAMAEPGWEQRNLQIVVETERVGTSSGAPRVVAVQTW